MYNLDTRIFIQLFPGFIAATVYYFYSSMKILKTLAFDILKV
jgi:hypothetical protein